MAVKNVRMIILLSLIVNILVLTINFFISHAKDVSAQCVNIMPPVERMQHSVTSPGDHDAEYYEDFDLGNHFYCGLSEYSLNSNGRWIWNKRWAWGCDVSPDTADPPRWNMRIHVPWAWMDGGANFPTTITCSAQCIKYDF